MTGHRSLATLLTQAALLLAVASLSGCAPEGAAQTPGTSSGAPTGNTTSGNTTSGSAQPESERFTPEDIARLFNGGQPAVFI